jgi:hypothetical protein
MSLTGVGKILFMTQNEIDRATLSASSAATPADRVKLIQPSLRWYGTDKVSEYLHATFSEDKLIQHIGLVDFTCDTQGKAQVQVFDADGEILTDTGDLELWEPVAGFGDDGFGDNLGGFPDLSDENDYRAYRFIDLGDQYPARAVRTYLKNPTNPLIAQAGLGWMFAGVGFQPEWTFNWPWTWKWNDPSEKTKTETSIAVRRRKTGRTQSLTMTDLTENEAIGRWNTIERALGTSKPMFVVLFPEGDAAPLRYATTIYGLMQESSGLTSTDEQNFSVSITIEELAA